MGASDIWNVEINIFDYENEMFLLPAEFHFNNCRGLSASCKYRRKEGRMNRITIILCTSDLKHR